jgi:uncharacterized protein YkwD
MKRILLQTLLAGGAALPLLLFGTATAASAGESCGLLVVCPPATPPTPTPTAPEPQPQPPAESQPAPQAAPAEPSHRSGAQITADLLVLLNRDRASHGLPAFTRRDDVDAVAARWSDHLAEQGSLSHNDAYFTSESRKRHGARALGENVAMDYEAQPAHEHLMASPHHRDNILDARFLVVGLGATYRDGKWWITQDFLQPASPAGREVARSAGAPARSRPPSAGVSAPVTAAPKTTAVGVDEGAVVPSEYTHWLSAPAKQARSTIEAALPTGSAGDDMPAGPAGVAIAGMCGVSGLLVRRRRVLAELATS